MQSPPLLSAAAPKGHTLGIVPTHAGVFLQPSPSEQPPTTTDPPPAVFLGSAAMKWWDAEEREAWAQTQNATRSPGFEMWLHHFINHAVKQAT